MQPWGRQASSWRSFFQDPQTCPNTKHCSCSKGRFYLQILEKQTTQQYRLPWCNFRNPGSSERGAACEMSLWLALFNGLTIKPGKLPSIVLLLTRSNFLLSSQFHQRSPPSPRTSPWMRAAMWPWFAWQMGVLSLSSPGGTSLLQVRNLAGFDLWTVQYFPSFPASKKISVAIWAAIEKWPES